MRLLSLDQSSKSTGWALFEDAKLTHYGVLKETSKNNETRMQHMCVRIRELLELYHPNKVVFEDVSLRTSPHVLIVLARLQGYIQLLCWESNIVFEIYSPSSWRKSVGIKTGKIKQSALKKEAQGLVESTFKVHVIDDIADAILIGLCDILHDQNYAGNI